MEKKKRPWYDNIERSIIIVLFILMTIILFTNVVTRYIFHFTFSWAEQAARFMFVWMTFAGVSLAGMTKSHLQVTVVNMVLGEKRAQYVFWFGDIVVVIFSLFLSYKISTVMMRVMATGQVFPAIPWLPAWPLYLSGVLGMFGFAARIIQRRVREVRDSKKEVTA